MRVVRSILFSCLVLSSGVASAAGDLLPIRSGEYVRAGSACHQPPLAALLTYDGSALSGPHSSRCRSSLVSKDANTFVVSTTCGALGDGSDATPFTETQRIEVRSPTTIRFEHEGDSAVYRRCGDA